MGVIFGHLVRPNRIVDGEMTKMPAVYILAPEEMNGNIIISKECVSRGKSKTEGYMIRGSKCNRFHMYFSENVDNGMTEDDCDDVLVLLDLLLKNKLNGIDFIPTDEINTLKKDNYSIETIRQARKSVHIIKGGSY